MGVAEQLSREGHRVSGGGSNTDAPATRNVHAIRAVRTVCERLRPRKRGEAVHPSIPAIIAALCCGVAVAGCASVAPDASPIAGTASGPNTFPRGTAAFCERYAEQTYNSTFQTQKTAASDAWAGQQAKVSARDAYRRCLEGKTS